MNVSYAKPLTRFRVYGHKSSLYFLCFVWPTKKAMLASRRREGLKGSCDAHVYAYDIIRCRNGHSRKKPIVGEIHFHRAKLGTEVITHESLHATASLLRRLKFDFSKLDAESMSGESEMSAEELFAGLQGKMARSIVTKLYELKLIT